MRDLEARILSLALEISDEPDMDVEWCCVLLRRFAGELEESVRRDERRQIIPSHE